MNQSEIKKCIDLPGLHVEITGSGPPLLLIHGLASSHRIWDLVVPHLAGRFTVLVADLRGHGQASGTAGPYDFGTLRGDVQSLMTRLSVDRLPVVGHSWGSSVALDISAHVPQAVSHLVLVDGGYLDFRGLLNLSWNQVLDQLAPPHIDLSVEEFNALARDSFGSYWRPEFAEIMLAHMQVTRDRVRPRLATTDHIAILRSMWEHDLASVYPLVEAPTLLIVADLPGPGTLDWESMKEQGVEQASRLLKNVEIVRMHDTLHDIPMQRPRELAQLIRRFVLRP